MTINTCFEQFLSNIEPDTKVVERVIQAHEEARDILANDVESKEWHVETFLAGSYRRETAIDPVKDVDIIVVTNFDPLNDPPILVLNKVKKVLDRHYNAQTDPQRRSICVTLADTDLTLDVVPAVAPNGAGRPLKIPDKEVRQWIWTHPKGHLARTSQLNANTKANSNDRGRFVPLVKMTKWWRTVHFPERRPRGFTLEVLAWSNHDPTARDWEDVFIAHLQRVLNDVGTYPRGIVPIIGNRDLFIDIKVAKTPEEFQAFLDTVSTCLELARSAKEAETLEEKVSMWQRVFGEEAFPNPAECAGDDEGSDDKGGGSGGMTGAPSILRGSSSDVRESKPFG